jgi:PKD repeat protein
MRLLNTIFITLLGVGMIMSISLAKPANEYSVQFHSGTVNFPENRELFLVNPDLKQERVKGHIYRYLQFYEVPTTVEQEDMANNGVELHDYIPNYTYLAKLPVSLDWKKLRSWGVRSIVAPTTTEKVSRRLVDQSFPDWAVSGDQISLNVQYYQGLDQSWISQEIRNLGYEILESDQASHFLIVKLPIDKMYDLAALSFINFIEPIDEPGKPEDTGGRTLHRANSLDSDHILGRKYDGSGVNILVRDDGNIGPHIDFHNRTIQMGDPPLAGTHGDGVAGVWAGAGNIDPTTKGAAPGAFVYVIDYLGTFLDNTLSLHQNNSVMITNSSYSNGCNSYTTTTQRVDQQTYTNPSLLHMFSAGNNNNSDCGYGAGNQWGNITGGHKQGKNVIAVANLFADGTLVNSSSRGPANDGRIKPDLAAHGQGQISIAPDNGYMSFGGTSAAAPSTAGVITQLYQAYRELNSGNDPESPLIKAVAMNSANDLGNPGPDFKYGWGLINGLGAVEILEQNQYSDSTVSQADTNTHVIPVPAGLKQVRIMVYWMDKEASTSAATALVNNLDMQVTTPGGTLFNPLVLNHAPNPVTLDAPAVQGIDNLNNVEQVRIDNPAAGNYTLKVRGKTVPFGPQKYYVVYHYVKDEIRITYPNGGEGFVPGENERIHWDAFGDVGSFTVKYSTDDGTTWNNITTSVAGDLRLYEWTVPNTVSGEVLISVSRGNLSDTSDYNFSIVETPQNISFLRLCPDTLIVSWDAVPGASGYDIFRLGNQYMDSIGSSNTNLFNLTGFTQTSENWFAVRAKGINGLKGRRSEAVEFISSFTCNDVSVSQFYGQNYSLISNCFGSSANISVILSNNGVNPQSNFDVSYRLNNGAIVTEIFTGTIPPMDSAVFHFSILEAFSVGTTNSLQAWSSLANDDFIFNDSVSHQFQILNLPNSIAPFTENFESESNCATTSNCGDTDCNLTGSWRNVTNYAFDDIDWRVDENGTPSNNTGPSVDHNPGTSSGHYLYTEASNGCERQQAELYSTCIDLGPIPNPVLSFWYHMEGGDIGELHVDVFDGTNLHLDAIPPLIGTQGSQWLEAQVWLAGFDSLVQVRFRGITGDGWQSDIAIDDISVENAVLPPLADFTASKTFVCAGEIVSFTDLTIQGVTSTSWSFNPQVLYTNNTDSTSNDPFVVFPNTGLYQVTLVSTNAYGSDTITKVNYIEVGNGDPIPFSEDFQDPGFPPTYWSIENPDGDITWEEISVTGAQGGNTEAASINNFSYNDAGQEDYLSSIPIDLTTAVAPILTFDVAYAPYSSTFEDDLRIDISDDCGNTFNNGIYFKGGINLATAPAQTSLWAPANASEWRNDTVDLTPFIGNIVVIRFTNITGYGNRLFIDNINVSEAVDIPPNASFSFSASPFCVGSPINIVSNSGGTGLQYNWQFGPNATPTSSTLPNPTVSYLATGMQTVTLILSNSLGTDTVSQNIMIEPLPDAAFSPLSTGINTFDFVNNSVGINTYTWNFGDGNTSNSVSPSHAYQANGTYQVTLTGTGDCGLDSMSAFVSVTGITPPTADFLTDNSNVICVGDTVTFTDASSGIGITSYDWFFGPGATPATANTAGPHTVVYTTAGSQNVTLTVINAEGSDVKSSSITVDSLPVADYTYGLSGGFQTYAFTNNSLAGATYNWDFGDGNLATDKNPVHTYAVNGSYQVVLIVENNCGKDTLSQTIDITNVGISESLDGMVISLFPNPNQGAFQVRVEGNQPGNLEGGNHRFERPDNQKSSG